MPYNPDAAIRSFLADAEKASEKIVTQALPNTDDDAETRILKRFTRDIQLIIVKAATEMGELPDNKDSLGRVVVLLAKCMLQGVAAITSPFTTDPDAIEHFLHYFAHEMDRTHSEDEDDE